MDLPVIIATITESGIRRAGVRVKTAVALLLTFPLNVWFEFRNPIDLGTGMVRLLVFTTALRQYPHVRLPKHPKRVV